MKNAPSKKFLNLRANQPTGEAEIARIRKVRSELTVEFHIVVLLAAYCGVEPYLVRIMQWRQIFLDEGWLWFRPRGCAGNSERPIPDPVVDILRQVRGQATSHLVCPALSRLNSLDFARQWRTHIRRAKVSDTHTLRALTWPFETEHPEQFKHDRRQRYLHGLASRWLPTEKILELQFKFPVNPLMAKMKRDLLFLTQVDGRAIEEPLPSALTKFADESKAVFDQWKAKTKRARLEADHVNEGAGGDQVESTPARRLRRGRRRQPARD